METVYPNVEDHSWFQHDGVPPQIKLFLGIAALDVNFVSWQVGHDTIMCDVCIKGGQI
jgi:hypothetical protein